MAILRNVVYCAILFFAAIANASTYNIQTSGLWYETGTASYGNSSASATCNAIGVGVLGLPSGAWGPNQFSSVSPNTLIHVCLAANGQPSSYSVAISVWCPSGGTPSGMSCINAPECPAPKTRDATTGSCVSPPCTAGDEVSSATYFGGWRVGTASSAVVGPDGQSYFQPPPESICDGTCTITMSTSGTCTSGAAPYVDKPQPIMCVGSGVKTGGGCSTNSAATGSPPVIPNHRPKCLAGEGVLTSSTGTVACVPSGVPAATPVVRTETQTQRFPDGSTKTIDTTYTKDPVSQVQDTQQKVTSTGTTGGGAGQAGAVGTSSTSGTEVPSSPTDKEASDFCQKNGQLQICKGDMNKEETQKQVLDYLKSLTNPGDTSFAAIQQAKQSAESDTDLKNQNDKFTAGAEGSTVPGQSSLDSWQSAMSSGWFQPISRTGCSPYTATIGSRTWTLDICPTADRISVISEYVIWFMIVVGTFVMLTGGAFSKGN